MFALLYQRVESIAPLNPSKNWAVNNLAQTVFGVIVIVVVFVSFPTLTSAADESVIEVISSNVTSEFPEGFRITLRVDAEADISFIAVRIKVGQRKRGAYDYLCQDRLGEECRTMSDGIVEAQMFWRTNTQARYIPPGTIITYNFEVEDVDGNLLETEQEEITYHDARFEWEEVTKGPVTVAYHGPVATRADLVRDAIIDTLSLIGPILGAETTTPIRVTMYNNNREMLKALPPGSTTIRRELVTEGQAFPEVGTLLVLGGDRMAAGTASHEVTHILVHRGGTSMFRRIPSWLNEGLAEFGNVDPAFSYEIALEFAIAQNRLLPVMFMDVLPGDPEDVIIFYGQARSIILLMIENFGKSKLTQLMKELQIGTNMDDAMLKIYGHDRLGIDTIWRESIGVEPYVAPDSEKARPTPVPARTLLPFTLTPQAQGETVGSKSEVPSVAQAVGTAVTQPVQQTSRISAGESNSDSSGPGLKVDGQDTVPSGGCNAPKNGANAPLDPTYGSVVIGLIMLACRRRLRR